MKTIFDFTSCAMILLACGVSIPCSFAAYKAPHHRYCPVNDAQVSVLATIANLHQVEHGTGSVGFRALALLSGIRVPKLLVGKLLSKLL